MKTYTFKMEGLDCANCAEHLEKKLQKIEGIETISINFFMQKVTLTCEEKTFEEIVKAIKKTLKKEEPDVSLEEIKHE